MNIGQAALNAVVVESEFLVVQSEQVQNRGMEIMWSNYVLLCLKAEFICSTKTHAAFYTSTGKPGGEAVRIMVSTVGAGLKHWHATKLRSENYECVFQ